MDLCIRDTAGCRARCGVCCWTPAPSTAYDRIETTSPAQTRSASVWRLALLRRKGRHAMIVASEQLWETFSAPIQQFILRRVPDPHSAEDILQDVFLKIHTRIDTLHQQDRVAAWIYQVARNAIADYYRAQRPMTDLPETLVIQQ